jgi:hypothetical protein
MCARIASVKYDGRAGTEMAGQEPKGEAMIVEATQAQVLSILGAMCRVAAPPSPADRAAIQAACR